MSADQIIIILTALLAADTVAIILTVADAARKGWKIPMWEDGEESEGREAGR